MTLDTLAFQKAIHGSRVTTIEVPEKDLLDRVRIANFERVSLHTHMNVRLTFSFRFQAKQIDIYNLRPFYESDVFKSNNFVYDSKRRVIIQTIPESMDD